jgi:flagellar hook-length control protein FliK
MINTSTEVTSALAPILAPPVAPAADLSAQNLRFDAALLEAAKAVRDGEGPDAMTLPAPSPKVEKALALLLEGLAQKPVENLRTLAGRPQQMDAVVDAAAQGLNAEEKTELKNLAPLALNRLIQVLGQTEEVKQTATLETSVGNSGPQGGIPGTPETLPIPAENGSTELASTFSQEEPSGQGLTFEQAVALSERPSGGEEAGVSPVVKPHSKEDETPASLASAMAWAPTLVSSRTDSGEGADSSVSLSSHPAENAPVETAQAPVSVTLLKPAEAPVSAAESPRAGTPLVLVGAATVTPPIQPQPAAVQNTATPAAERPTPVSNPAIGNTRPAVEAATVRTGNAGEQDSSTPAQAPSAAKNAPIQPVPVQDGLEFSVEPASQANNAPAIDAESLITFNSDGSFNGKLSLATPQAGTPVPAVSGAPLQAPVPAVQPDAPAALTPAPDSTRQAPAPQALAAVNATAPSAPAYSLAGLPVPAAAPASVQTETDGTFSVPTENESGADFAVTAQAESPEAEPAFRFQASERASQVTASQLAAASGFDAVRAAASQAARDLGVREAVFKQVGEALRVVENSVSGGQSSGRLVIKLKPVSLGDVHVDLSLNDGKLTARLIAGNAEVRDAFVRDLPAFKAGLQAQGVSIDQISVAVRAETNLNQGQSQPQQDPWRGLAPEMKAWNPETPALSLGAGAWSVPGPNPQQFSALA